MFDNIKENYIKKYGVDNPMKLEKVKNKVKNTNIDRYGVENPMQCSEIVDKSKLTKLERYGDSNYNNRNMAKITNLERYGVENISQVEETMDKIKITNLRKYGVDNPMKLEKVKNKVKNTNINRYGVDNPMKLEKVKNKVKNTNLRKYGVEYPLQNIDIYNKMIKSSFITNIYKNNNITYQGSYELDFLNKYFNKVIIEKSEPIKYKFKGNDHIYYPDFYLPEYNLIIEIKSSYTFENKLKINLRKYKYSVNNGYNFIFIIDKKYDDLNKLLKKSNNKLFDF